MAANDKPAPASTPSAPDDLDALAFQLFSDRAAASGRGGEPEALDSYRKAENFIAVRRRVRAGELKSQAPTGPQLADCCAPNLPRTHPLNLVAAQYTDRRTGMTVAGDLAKVNRIKVWLDRNPTPEKDAEELPGRLAKEFPDLNWDLPTLNVARAVFPAHCGN